MCSTINLYENSRCPLIQSKFLYEHLWIKSGLKLDRSKIRSSCIYDLLVSTFSILKHSMFSTSLMLEFEKLSLLSITRRTTTKASHVLACCSAEEAGRYLETFKAYENKPSDLIMEKTESNFLSQVRF